MGIRKVTSYKVFNVPLWIIGICGGVGVLVDADHLIAYYTGQSGRFLHTPLLIVSIVIILGLGSYLARLFIRSVLK